MRRLWPCYQSLCGLCSEPVGTHESRRGCEVRKRRGDRGGGVDVGRAQDLGPGGGEK